MEHGKSTTIKIMCGILTPDSGICKINGFIPYKDRKKYVKDIGVVFGNRSALWWDVPVEDSFELIKEIYNISDENYKKQRNMLTEMLNIGEIIKTPTRQLSLGQRMRCEIAAAFLHEPKIVFLDEPTSGLDPATTLQIHSMMKTLKESGTTIFLTTHNMNEAQKMCDHLALLNEGNIVEEGTPEDICLLHRKKCEVNIEMTNGEKYMVDSHDLLTVLQTVLDTNNKIRSIHSNEPNLEEVFIELTGRDLR